MEKKIRKIRFNFEPYITKEFGRYSINFELIKLFVRSTRGMFANQKWSIYHFYFELLNFSIDIDYEV